MSGSIALSGWIGELFIMDFALWWLLAVPILFTLGWLAARIDIHYLIKETRQLPASYARGVLQLIQGAPDKAIDSLVEVLRNEPESVDMHFALAHLLRRRGDTAQAIALHQNLLKRSDLSLAQSAQAQYELGQDFMKAGLLDRAEECFVRLPAHDFSREARLALIEIYQRQKDWTGAIKVAEQLERMGVANQQQKIAHFYCELAQDELVQNRVHEAVQSLQQARAINRGSVRANMMLGDCWQLLKQPQQAIDEWSQIEQQNLAYLGLVAARLMSAYREIGRASEGLNLLQNYLQEHFSVDVLLVLFAEKQKHGDLTQNLIWMRTILMGTPSLLGVDQLLQLHLSNSAVTTYTETVRDDLQLYRQQIQNLIQTLSRYKCTHCGFKARQFYWQCPGCQNWDTTQPYRIEELLILQ